MDEQRQQLLTAREAAEYLRISLATLRRMEKKGHLLPFHTLGGHRRYSRTMLDAYLERSQRPPFPQEGVDTPYPLLGVRTQ
jgi:excisionase family DNA binding protein